jgi:hypothetical protein
MDPMISRLLAVCLAVMVAGSPGCASQSASADRAPKPGKIIPPRIHPAGGLRFETNVMKFDYLIEVPIDERGQPDISGMRIMGNMPPRTREDIAEWIGRATFDPARQDGVPVRGVFKMNLRR